MDGRECETIPDRVKQVSQSRTGRFAFDVASSVLTVVAIGAFLFAVSGVWSPVVAVESGSMHPHVEKGDLVFVMEEQRFPGVGAAEGSGVVTAHVGRETDYRMFNADGDVIVFHPDGSETATPIIHRAMFRVTEGENWYDRADPAALGTLENCEETPNCPAPYAGFVTKGDNNERYDQVVGHSGIVRSEWIAGTAEVAVPWLGRLRLARD